MDEQQERWEDSFARNPGMFGDQPSDPARKALQLCHGESVGKLLALGGGQGRDTIFFTQNGRGATQY
jgi:hypothetical protein